LERIRPDAVVAVPPRGCSGLPCRRAGSEVAGAAAVRVGRPVQGGAVRGPALRRERLDGLGPRAGRRLGPCHGHRARRRQARLRGVPRRPRDSQQRADPQRDPLLGQGHFSFPTQGRPVVHRVRQPRRHALRVAAGVVLPRRHPARALPISGGHANLSFRGTPRIELMKTELNRDGADGLSRSSVGPQELWPGVSNYVLQVLSHEKQQDPALLMYFLDSGGGSYPEVISSAQVRWFGNQSQSLNPDGFLS
uniref:Uncharacterized protein n=1 Tax=Aegilops tauschii subsp. strangulata TaxID=200361 RepID=A0A453GLG2_AEGTS